MLGKFKETAFRLVGDTRTRKRLLWLSVAAVVLVVLALDSTPNRQVVSGTGGFTAPQPARHSSTAIVARSPIFVSIAGAVRHEGVYRLHTGDRVFSLVFMAGGFLADASQESVNLARVLIDGEQVIVGSRQSSSGSTGYSPSSTSSLNQKLPINNSSPTQLETLPGIGPTLAQRIAQYRDAHGPFRSKADLLSVPGIGPKLVAGFADSISY